MNFRLVLLGLIASTALLWAAEISIPRAAPVVDEVGLLSQEASAIEQALIRLQASGKAEMAVFVAKDLRGLDLESFSIGVVEQWKLGKKDVDNGLLLLIVPSDRKMRIEVGYGLEGEITDAFSSTVIRKILTPYFRQNQFGLGVLTTVGAVAQKLNVDLDIPVRAPKRAKKSSASRFFPLLILVFLFFNFFGGGRRRRFYGGGYYGGFGGFGGRMGGGGGGFGGFSGGGGFGGGGASGSW